MPAGKLGAVAGSVWIRRLDGDVILGSSIPYGVSVRSLKPYRSARKDQPDAATIEGWRRRLRDAFRQYLVDCGRTHLTATRVRTLLSAIVRFAERVIEAPRWEHFVALLTALEEDRSVETFLRRALSIPGNEWVRFKTELRGLCWGQRVPDDCLADFAVGIAANVIRISSLDVAEVVPQPGPWRDPALQRLVATLVPLWRDVTGRSAGPVSIDRECERRAFPFASWLEEMHGLIRVPNPPAGRILDIIRSVEKPQKNPAPVTT